MNLVVGLNKTLNQALRNVNPLKFSQNVSSVKVVKFATLPDSVVLSKKSDVILNKKLLNEFGITSDITDKNLLTKILQTVQKFSELNSSKKLLLG